MKSLLIRVLVLVAWAGPAFSQEGDTAGGLSEAEREQLDRDGLVITQREYRQIFEPYIFSKMPVFVTSDTVLNAYHVLFEESLAAMERSQAVRIGAVLERVWGNLENRRARLVVGVALGLLGGELAGVKDDELALIRAEVDRVEAAMGYSKPAWLGPAEPDFLAIDYTRFKPVGFYTRDQAMRRYFRALSWLQAIPFRLADDEELRAMAAIGAAIDGDDWRQTVRDLQVLHRYAEFVGAADDWDIQLANERLRPDHSPEENRLNAYRIWGNDADQLPRVNDHVRFAPADPRMISEPNFRIISAARLPDAVLMQRTFLRRDGSPHRWPSGLDLGAALGSGYACKKLVEESPQLLEIAEQSRPLFRPRASLYQDYLHCLQALLDPAHPGAPELFRSEAWQIKSLNTALAGWSQLRHSWALQAKESTFYAGIDTERAGFVEPDPEFFSRFAVLVSKSMAAFEKEGAIAIAPENVAGAIEQAIAVIEEISEFGEIDEDDFSDEEKEAHWEASERLYERAHDLLLPLRPLLVEMDGGPEYPWQTVPKDIPAVVAELKVLLPVAQSKAGARTLARGVAYGEQTLLSRWRELESIVRRLSALANKQVAGVPFNEADNHFLRGFGKPLASVMFYDGNSWQVPRDTAPRAVTVFSGEGSYLHVATGRPRAIFVHYPVGDQTVLCRGAVMSYYEFRENQRLDDQLWLGRIQADKAPPLPAFTAPVFSRGE